MTVVFADLVDFTAMSESMDPESVKELLDDCFGALVPVVESHGGHVDKIIGDELMATFGAPISHQDDPERAVAAALELLEVLAERFPSLKLRIGVNTGEVLAGSVGPLGAYTVTGDAVNTAHRLVQLAKPGDVLVGDHTYTATAGSVTYDTLPPAMVHGKAEPLVSWRATGLVDRDPDPVDESTGTGFYGRTREVSRLVGIITASLTQRRPAVIAVTGEGGVGKTRIVDHALSALQIADLQIVKVRCRGFGNVSGAAATEAVIRGLLGTTHATHEEEREVIEARVGELAARSGVREAFLRDSLIDILAPVGAGRTADGSDPVPWSQRIESPAGVLQPLLAAIACDTPTVLVIDDLHVAEAGLLSTLEHLPARLGSMGLVVIGIGRSELIDRRPGFFVGSAGVSSLVVEPLGDDDARDLLQDLLTSRLHEARDSMGIGPDTEEQLLEASGGNPLLLEEFVTFLDDRGDLMVNTGNVQVVVAHDERALPDGIRSLLWARIDALSPAARRFLLDAAVVGTRFWPEAVLALDSDADASVLGDLIEEGLLEQVADQGDGTVAFRHRLARDVAYAAVPIAERAHKHARVARWLEDNDPSDREGRVAGLLAHHVEQAVLLNRELEHTDPGLASGAFRTLVLAGQEAERYGSTRDAERWYRRALRLGTFDPVDLRGAQLALARVLLSLRRIDESRDLLDGLLADLDGVDPGERLPAVTMRAVVTRVAGDIEGATAGFDEALTLADESGAVDQRAVVLLQAGMAELMSGRPRAALPRLRQANRLLGDESSPGTRGETLRHLGWCEFLVGEPGAEKDLTEASALLFEAGNVGLAQWCIGILGFVHLQFGETSKVLSIAEMLITEVRRRGESWSESSCTLLAAAARLQIGDTIEAASLLDRAARWFLELGDGWGQVMGELVAGMIALSTGNLDRAVESLERGLVLAPEVASLGEESRLLVELARVALARGDVEETRRRATSAVALVRSGVGGIDSEVQALSCLAEVALIEGTVAEAIVLLEESVAAGGGLDDGIEGSRRVTSGTRQSAARLAPLLMSIGETERGAQMLRLASEPTDESLPTAVAVAVAQAEIARHRGDVNAARTRLNGVMRRFPDSSHVLLDNVRGVLDSLDPS